MSSRVIVSNLPRGPQKLVGDGTTQRLSLARSRTSKINGKSVSEMTTYEHSFTLQLSFFVFLSSLVLSRAAVGRHEDDDSNISSSFTPFDSRRVTSNEVCLTALLEADLNFDNLLDQSEYLIFVKRLTPDSPADELDLVLQAKFNVLACLCRSREGDDCCLGDNRDIDVARAAFSDEYLNSVCLLTESGIQQSGNIVTISERPSASPVDNIMLRPSLSWPSIAPMTSPMTIPVMAPVMSGAPLLPPTVSPSTPTPSTAQPVTTLAPSTAQPVTLAPSTAQPVTTLAPSTAQPVTLAPSTAQPVTTLAPSTAPLTPAPTVPTISPATLSPTTAQPISVPSTRPAEGSQGTSSPSVPLPAVNILKASFLISVINGRSELVSDEEIRKDLISAMIIVGKTLPGLSTSLRRYLRRKLQELDISATILDRLDASK